MKRHSACMAMIFVAAQIISLTSCRSVEDLPVTQGVNEVLVKETQGEINYHEESNSLDTPPPTATHLSIKLLPSVTPKPSETLAAATSLTTTEAPKITATPTPTDSSSQLWLPSSLEALVDSQHWPLRGLSKERIEAWEAYARGHDLPSEDELVVIKAFIDQWTILSDLVLVGHVPARREIGLFADERKSEGGGSDVVNLYAADPSSMHDGRPTHFFLIARDKEGKDVALVIAPEIQGLNQRLSSYGGFVEYVDEDGELILTADARKLDDTSKQLEYLKEMLDRNNPEHYYSEHSTYPRFRINNPGVESSFYLIEQLTYNQILLLISTFQLFDRPELAGMKPEIFPAGDDVDFIISRDPHPFAAALAMPLGGVPKQGIVVLFSKNIFDNRYDTASSIAHEATHIWQGKSPDCNHPDARLKREVGNQTIPEGFYQWTAEELVRAAKQDKIGSYHVSLWVLIKFGQNAHAEWIKDVIITGRANGSPIINCG